MAKLKIPTVPWLLRTAIAGRAVGSLPQIHQGFVMAPLIISGQLLLLLLQVARELIALYKTLKG